MQGGINNAALFNASQREARGKLEQMAGIKRPPSGILASSPELMNAVGNAAAPAMPVRATGPVTSAPVPTVQAALPQVPAPTTVAPGSVQQAAPAPQPAMMQEGGPVDVGKTPSDITSQVFGDFLTSAGTGFVDALMGIFGSKKAAEQAGRNKLDIIESATTATDDPKKVSDAVMVAAEVEPTNENKKDFARNVFGMEDVNDIDEINRRIADVAISSAIGKGPDEFAQAVLLGLQNYKQTASARAAAKSGGGSGMSPLEPFPDAVRDLAGKIMTATGEDPAVAIQQARDALAPYYTGQAGPTTTTTETTETATVTIEQHKSANDAAKQAGQKTYTLGGQEFQVQ